MSGGGGKGPHHRWEDGRCKFCHVRRDVYPGPRGGIEYRYWSPYLGEVCRHPMDRDGSPPCDPSLYDRAAGRAALDAPAGSEARK